MAAASWVASRSFYVDRTHGIALVPLADVFNHKAAVVSLAGDFQIVELGEGTQPGSLVTHPPGDTDGPLVQRRRWCSGGRAQIAH